MKGGTVKRSWRNSYLAMSIMTALSGLHGIYGNMPAFNERGKPIKPAFGGDGAYPAFTPPMGSRRNAGFKRNRRAELKAAARK